MTIEALNYIDNVLNGAGINYEFGQWSSMEVPSPYFVGEYTDSSIINEDGLHQSTLLLTGTTRSTWLGLMEAKDIIEGLFPSVNDKIAKLENGSRLAIFFDTSMIIPTDTMEFKRLQINLIVKEWKVD